MLSLDFLGHPLVLLQFRASEVITTFTSAHSYNLQAAISSPAMDEDELSLNITPSFKSRSSKGKARATPRSQNNDALNHPQNGSAATLEDANGDNDGDDAGNSSAVLFKRSSSKNKGKSLLGGATASSSSSSARKLPTSGTSTSKSRLNVSFGNEDVDNSEDNATAAGTSRASSYNAENGDDDSMMMDGDVSVSEVRKINRRNRKLGQGIGSSSLTKAAEK